jgi:hypothetical protein
MTMPIKAEYDLATRMAFAKETRERRHRLISEGYCLNGRTHGKVKDGVRCPWCIAVHRQGLAAVLSDPNAPAQPKGYVMRMRPAKMPVASEESW